MYVHTHIYLYSQYFYKIFYVTYKNIYNVIQNNKIDIYNQRGRDSYSKKDHEKL